MRNKTLWLASALAALVFAGAAAAGPQGKEGAARGSGDKAGCADKGQAGVGKEGFASRFGDKAALGKEGFGRGFGDKAAPGKEGPARGSGDRGGRGDRFQGPGGRGGPGGGFPGGRGGDGFQGGRGLSNDAIVERLMSFDKNKDGKITKDELSERMQDLIAKGDANKDGALDKDEITKLATTLARDGGFGGFGGGFGPGGFPPGGGFRPPGGGIRLAVDDLKLTDKKKDQADAVVRTHEEKVRKLMDEARADLLVKMKEVLSAEEFAKFKEAVERQPGPPPFPPAPPAPPTDVEKKLDQLQKELDNLRRELRK